MTSFICAATNFFATHHVHNSIMIIRRGISSSEIATALRPFYFAVHPDLFGRHPEQRSVNEESLKHLSAYLEALQQKRLIHTIPKVLQFYVRYSDTERRDTFRLVKISLARDNNTKDLIRRVLESCDLSTEYVDQIKCTRKDTATQNRNTSSKFYDFTEENQNPFSDINFGSEFVDFEEIFRKRKDTKAKTLRNWLNDNFNLAHERKKDLENLQGEVEKLQNLLAKRLQLKDIRFDCGWNLEHYRGSLKTLERLANQYQNDIKALKGRIVVFAPFTGVSREGHVMLYTGDVPYSWIDFIKNIARHDVYLKRIPAYEIALSQVLRNIKIGRRKFMPKSQAFQYAGHLRKVTTTLLDYLTTSKYPKSWPDDLSEFEIVIESESGPLMVSPTGQIIIPSTCPSTILVEFLTNNLNDAREKTEQYNRNKYIERELHKRCLANLKLKSLTKDDSVTPEKMIKTLEKLVKSELKNTTNIHLHITNYYSVLADGTVCIPWDFSLD